MLILTTSLCHHPISMSLGDDDSPPHKRLLDMIGPRDR
jgi:hypothetical protein